MEWAAIAVLGLAVWVWRQSRRIETLTLELAALKARVSAMSAPPLLLDRPLVADDNEPLLLDTPIPEASNDSAEADRFAPPKRIAPQTAMGAPKTAALLAALAMLAALAAPLAGAELRPPAATTLFLCIIAAAGFAFAASNRSVWVALATFAGLFAWFIAAIDVGDVARALAVTSLAALGGLCLGLLRDGERHGVGVLPWSRLRAFAPSVAIAVSSVLTIWCWLAVAELHDAGVGRLAWVGAMLVALAAAAVRIRNAAPASFAVAVISLVAGFVFFIGIRFQFPPLGDDFYAAVLACAATVALATHFAKPHRRSRLLVAAVGSVGAAVLIALAATTRDDWHSLAAWGALFGGGAALLACASRQEQNALAPWIAAGAGLVLLGVESAFPESWRSAAHAGAAASLAAVFAWRNWRAAGVSALAAAAIALAYALNTVGETTAFAATTLTAVFLFAASRVAEEAAFQSVISRGLSISSAVTTLMAFLQATDIAVSTQVVLLLVALGGGVAALVWSRRGGLAKPASSSTAAG